MCVRPVVKFSTCCLHHFVFRKQRCTPALTFTHIFFFFDDLSGIRSWDTNLIDCNLDQELKLFVSRHSARFSADVKGKQKLKKKMFTVNDTVKVR